MNHKGLNPYFKSISHILLLLMFEINIVYINKYVKCLTVPFMYVTVVTI